MNWLIDAQLPRRLAHRLRTEGEDVLHALDLPDGNRTTDAALRVAFAAQHFIELHAGRAAVSTLLVIHS